MEGEEEKEERERGLKKGEEESAAAGGCGREREEPAFSSGESPLGARGSGKISLRPFSFAFTGGQWKNTELVLLEQDSASCVCWPMRTVHTLVTLLKKPEVVVVSGSRQEAGSASCPH